MVAFARVFFKRPCETWVWAAAIIITTCIFFTLTRQVWFGFIVGILFLGFVWKRKYFLVSLVLVIFITFVPNEQKKTHFQDFFLPKGDTFIDQAKFRIYGMLIGTDYTFGVRLALWKGGWEIFKDYPLTGCGFRCVDVVNSQYPDPTGFIKRHRGMHNNFMQLAVDTGVFGLTAWLVIWVCFFRLLYKRIAALKGEPDSQWIIIGSAATGVAFLSGGFSES
jgi:O-antigen ligase